MNIIVAEDDSEFNGIITQFLKDLGHEVRAFSSADDAWVAFGTEPADVIFSDWAMPGMDGLEFCRRVRQLHRKNYVYFILATGNRTNVADHDSAMRVGVDDFLIKPIHLDEIWRRLAVAKRILDFTRRIQQLKSLLPACMRCKTVRDDNHYWQEFEIFIGEQQDEDLASYICPDCQNAVEARVKTGA
jgi:DNA-binding response OmpR family regulator